MMEPVAWTRKSRKTGAVKLSDFPMIDNPFNHKNWEEQPLVRLSDAEARIKELEAKLAEADALIEAQQHDFAQNNIRNAENAHRAEAAEALLKEAGKALEQQRKALEPLSNAVFNDNGDISVNYPVNFTSEHCIAAYFADRAARSIADKIGGKDE